MTNGWTGGQYSAVRAAVAVYILSGIVRLAPASGTAYSLALSAVAVVAAVLLAAGWRDRLAALVLGALIVDVNVRAGSATVSALLPALGVLALHASVPAAPYGSWSARGRLDPGGAWRMPAATLLAARALTAAAYIAAVASGGVSIAGLALLQLLAIDPRVIRPQGASSTEWIFYDGACGLCHGAVRFVLAEDARPFRFAPLDSDTFRRAVPAGRRTSLPDSIVVLTDAGQLLTRSAAVLHIMRRLGGLWRAAASIAGTVIPGVLLDGLYDGIARIRRQLFATPSDTCPLLPPNLRAQFDD